MPFALDNISSEELHNDLHEAGEYICSHSMEASYEQPAVNDFEGSVMTAEFNRLQNAVWTKKATPVVAKNVVEQLVLTRNKFELNFVSHFQERDIVTGGLIAGYNVSTGGFLRNPTGNIDCLNRIFGDPAALNHSLPRNFGTYTTVDSKLPFAGGSADIAYIKDNFARQISPVINITKTSTITQNDVLYGTSEARFTTYVLVPKSKLNINILSPWTGAYAPRFGPTGPFTLTANPIGPFPYYGCKDHNGNTIQCSIIPFLKRGLNTAFNNGIRQLYLGTGASLRSLSDWMNPNFAMGAGYMYSYDVNGVTVNTTTKVMSGPNINNATFLTEDEYWIIRFFKYNLNDDNAALGFVHDALYIGQDFLDIINQPTINLYSDKTIADAPYNLSDIESELADFDVHHLLGNPRLQFKKLPSGSYNLTNNPFMNQEFIAKAYTGNNVSIEDEVWYPCIKQNNVIISALMSGAQSTINVVDGTVIYTMGFTNAIQLSSTGSIPNGKMWYPVHSIEAGATKSLTGTIHFKQINIFGVPIPVMYPDGTLATTSFEQRYIDQCGNSTPFITNIPTSPSWLYPMFFCIEGAMNQIVYGSPAGFSGKEVNKNYTQYGKQVRGIKFPSSPGYLTPCSAANIENVRTTSHEIGHVLSLDHPFDSREAQDYMLDTYSQPPNSNSNIYGANRFKAYYHNKRSNGSGIVPATMFVMSYNAGNCLFWSKQQAESMRKFLASTQEDIGMALVISIIEDFNVKADVVPINNERKLVSKNLTAVDLRTNSLIADKSYAHLATAQRIESYNMLNFNDFVTMNAQIFNLTISDCTDNMLNARKDLNITYDMFRTMIEASSVSKPSAGLAMMGQSFLKEDLLASLPTSSTGSVKMADSTSLVQLVKTNVNGSTGSGFVFPIEKRGIPQTFGEELSFIYLGSPNDPRISNLYLANNNFLQYIRDYNMFDTTGAINGDSVQVTISPTGSFFGKVFIQYSTQDSADFVYLELVNTRFNYSVEIAKLSGYEVNNPYYFEGSRQYGYRTYIYPMFFDGDTAVRVRYVKNSDNTFAAYDTARVAIQKMSPVKIIKDGSGNPVLSL